MRTINLDAIVIGAPMYNFSVTSGLKAWIDHVARAGRTFKYGANGPEGLVHGKKVIVFVASGGVYSEGPAAAYDQRALQTPWLVLAFEAAPATLRRASATHPIAALQTDDFAAPPPRVLSAARQSPQEEALERALRPKLLDEYVGQAKVREQLEIFIGAAKMRSEALDHVLLFGPPGLGKTTLSHIIAAELGVNLRQTSGPVLEKPKDLAALLTNEINNRIAADTVLQGEINTEIARAEAAEAIARASRLERIDFDHLRHETDIVGYPILPLVHQLVAMCGEAGRYVHWGATTQDIMDTALALRLQPLTGNSNTCNACATRLPNTPRPMMPTGMAERGSTSRCFQTPACWSAS